jgi:hypothetical protein
MELALRYDMRAPDFGASTSALAEGARLTERGGQLSLTSLPLEWDAAV